LLVLALDIGINVSIQNRIYHAIITGITVLALDIGINVSIQNRIYHAIITGGISQREILCIAAAWDHFRIFQLSMRSRPAAVMAFYVAARLYSTEGWRRSNKNYVLGWFGQIKMLKYPYNNTDDCPHP
jgi:hypothetical protein